MNIQPFLDASLAIQVHMIAAVLAFFLGAFVLWRRKGTTSHKLNGRIWVGLMLITSLSGFFIHEIRLWGNFSPIHFFSVLVPIALFVAIRNARNGNIRAHKSGMQATYLGSMIVAGGFTFLPGRLNHDIFLGPVELASIPLNYVALPIIVALGIAAVATVRSRAN